MHGDLYGHNILINSSAGCLLGDFGAASHYHPLNLDSNAVVEKIEVRAFSCLLEELLARIKEHEVAIYDEIILKLHALQESCHSENNSDRPVLFRAKISPKTPLEAQIPHRIPIQIES